jgi:hypothetical protein
MQTMQLHTGLNQKRNILSKLCLAGRGSLLSRPRACTKGRGNTPPTRPFLVPRFHIHRKDDSSIHVVVVGHCRPLFVVTAIDSSPSCPWYHCSLAGTSSKPRRIRVTSSADDSSFANNSPKRPRFPFLSLSPQSPNPNLPLHSDVLSTLQVLCETQVNAFGRTWRDNICLTCQTNPSQSPPMRPEPHWLPSPSSTSSALPSSSMANPHRRSEIQERRASSDFRIPPTTASSTLCCKP